MTSLALVDNGTNFSKVVTLRIIHGASTAPHATTITTRWRKRIPRDSDRVNSTHGTASSGISNIASPLASAASAITAPNHAAVDNRGLSLQRYARIIVVVTSRAISPSGYNRLSISHRLGYTAANPAATS